jgi:hypothetical protein
MQYLSLSEFGSHTSQPQSLTAPKKVFPYTDTGLLGCNTVNTNISDRHFTSIFRTEDGGITTQKTDFDILTTMKTSNFSHLSFLHDN